MYIWQKLTVKSVIVVIKQMMNTINSNENMLQSNLYQNLVVLYAVSGCYFSYQSELK